MLLPETVTTSHQGISWPHPMRRAEELAVVAFLDAVNDGEELLHGEFSCEELILRDVSLKGP